MRPILVFGRIAYERGDHLPAPLQVDFEDIDLVFATRRRGQSESIQASFDMPRQRLLGGIGNQGIVDPTAGGSQQQITQLNKDNLFRGQGLDIVDP
jgi:hypothetical protein